MRINTAAFRASRANGSLNCSLEILNGNETVEPRVAGLAAGAYAIKDLVWPEPGACRMGHSARL